MVFIKALEKWLLDSQGLRTGVLGGLNWVTKRFLMGNRTLPSFFINILISVLTSGRINSLVDLVTTTKHEIPLPPLFFTVEPIVCGWMRIVGILWKVENCYQLVVGCKLLTANICDVNIINTDATNVTLTLT